MDDLKRARKNAQGRRKDVLKNFETVRARLTLPQLADDALAMLDPGLILPRRITTAVASQPLASALLFGGAAWLLSIGGDRSPPARSRRSHSKIRPSTEGA